MAPRKRASSSSSSRRSNQSLQQSQPSKFGIQHFFERHSQATAAAEAAASSTPSNPTNPPQDPEAEPTQCDPPATAAAPQNAEEKEDKDPSLVSPEISKAVSVRRFRFSPGMLVKQSQDDGADEVTWKISPVNERLRSLTAKQLQDTSDAAPTASKLSVSRLRSCSQENSPCFGERLEKRMSSPTTVAPGKSLEHSNRVFLRDMLHRNGCDNNGHSSIVSTRELQSPFRTPPSTTYVSLEPVAGVSCNGTSDQLGSMQHRKALLELLDQVEDAIAVDVSLSCGSKRRLKGHTEASCKMHITIEGHHKTFVDTPEEDLSAHCNQAFSSEEQHKTFVYTPEGDLNSHCSQNFLVLEVLEKHRADDSTQMRQPMKVLRLLNEQSGQERALHLCDEWFYSLIGPGDAINVIGEFDGHGQCVVDRNKNLVIVHPHILVSGTRVASSFSCPRRAVLDERLKITEHSSPALIGTLLHQIFQAGLLKDFPTRAFLEEYAGIILQQNIENLYACGVSESDTYATLVEAIPRMLNWVKIFRDEQVGPTNDNIAGEQWSRVAVPRHSISAEPRRLSTSREARGSSSFREGSRKSTADFGQYGGEKLLTITEVIDIEEMARAPRYGLKGMIDASLRIKMGSVDDSPNEKIIPLEFKTGKGTAGQAAMEHRAQVILYTLLMSERYLNRDIDSGLIYYLHTDQTQGIKVQRSDLVGIIMRRNELATDILKASTIQILPPKLQSPSICKSCRHLNVCAVYHKAHGGADSESGGLQELFGSIVDHLTIPHCDFLQHWDRLIDLEAKASLVAKGEMLHNSSSKKDHNSLSSLVLDISKTCSVADSSKNGRYIYHFVHKDMHSMMHNRAVMDVASSQRNNLDYTLRCGDFVVLSTESGHAAVARGVIADICPYTVSVALSRRLRLPGSSSSTDESKLTCETWRIDKDDAASSYAIMRFNLVQLFLQSTHGSHLRKMIVDLEAPRFDSGGIGSQDPAVSYVQSESTLNNDQRRAIHKILAAKDYALILGMPGTGKTSTMVHAVKALLIRGASILLTSYTNSAVDNLLIKLKVQGIDFIRIGRKEAMYDGIREHCHSGKQNLEDIKQRMEHVRVVGVTCLGINHPLLAKRKFDVCIMDEAGQIALPVSLGPLMFATKFVLVGDHYQLPPLVQSAEALENGLGISLFRRLSEAHPQAISALQCQYRMCAGIMELSNALIYGNRLLCGSPDIANAKLKFSCVKPLKSWLKKVLDPNRSVVFINTDMLPAREVKEQNTINNPTEGYIVSEVVRELINRDVAGEEIGIITPYNSQVDLIRRAVGTAVEIHTIDKYQGRDKDCILVSFVRSSDRPTSFSTSLLGDWHRINVALTRAKKKLIMVGSRGTLSRVPLLKLLIEKVEEQDGIFTLSGEDIHRMKELKKCTQTSV